MTLYDFLDKLTALAKKYQRKDFTYRYWGENDSFEGELEELLENALEAKFLDDFSIAFDITQKTPFFTTGVLMWCAVDKKGILHRNFYNVLTKTNYVKEDE